MLRGLQVLHTTSLWMKAIWVAMAQHRGPRCMHGLALSAPQQLQPAVMKREHRSRLRMAPLRRRILVARKPVQANRWGADSCRRRARQQQHGELPVSN